MIAQVDSVTFEVVDDLSQPFPARIRLMGAAASVIVEAADRAPVCLCTPPANFVNPIAPMIGPARDLISRTEHMVFDLARPQVVALLEHAALEDLLPDTKVLPSVIGVHMLTPGDFREAGSRRLVCLSDGSFAVEQALERVLNEKFRYLVWNYTSKRARMIGYAVGEFLYFDEGPNRTKIAWTYSFKLNERSLLGRLGPLGAFLFKVGFLDNLWAKFMTSTVATMRAYVLGSERQA